LGNGHLYVSDDARLHIIHIDRTGATGPLEYASTSGIVTSLACDEEGVMWTTDNGELRRIPHYDLGGPAPCRVGAHRRSCLVAVLHAPPAPL
jgi:hypothetical protein